jgi:hypothetical protein
MAGPNHHYSCLASIPHATEEKTNVVNHTGLSTLKDHMAEQTTRDWEAYDKCLREWKPPPVGPRSNLNMVAAVAGADDRNQAKGRVG